ncbi:MULTISPECIES: phosphate ABC transporter permease subunit PstC [unclassified Pseudodesulfovibrio]|uniref:phosphate ABC transporter permease subunit PstC n=1 Tax=unclassified Pseudodesulfovibrio TaxID=2661612 RepID=UPI000FEBB8B3|nr:MULTISPECIES: phosphate ABC transporter permease subunit PstC [unclassified Pseudodesulfovibrio]MCJ2166038.1 phosphate ABC transporter permease subunit PstC [Pseudodesulfovibrio sp. S3-i]RWU02525.1 phosphate ABC transporter permease subunit PstC [Pseudodesulfovibrio sp. S3]
MLSRSHKEKAIKTGFLLAASASIIALGLIMYFLVGEALPTFTGFDAMGAKVPGVSFYDFVFGAQWKPISEHPQWGILPLIMGSVWVTLISSLIAIPLGIMTAIYLAEIAPHKVREIVKPMVELLASLPSVVIGFFGLAVVAPILLEIFDIRFGVNMLNASIMLAFMAVPTITSIAEDSIHSVPNEVREGSLALGATRFETIWRVVLPSSLSGLSTAVILGMSRSIGETMVVLMVAGGAARIPTSIFDPVRPMPASIAAEMGETSFGLETHYFALFAIAMVLFVITFLFNLLADHIAHKYKQVGSATL